MTGRILVAGLGNVFCRDDAFGVAVVDRLAQRSWPDGVEIRDFGIRGIHLAYQLLEPYDLVVLVDSVQRGSPPGTIQVIDAEPGTVAGATMDAHDLTPDAVLALVPRLGGSLGQVVVIGCEPTDLDAGLGLSPAVDQSVETAARLVVDIVVKGVVRKETS